MFGLETIVVLLIVLAVVIMWRGPKMLPKWGRTLGRGVKATRKEIEGVLDGKDDIAGPSSTL